MLSYTCNSDLSKFFTFLHQDYVFSKLIYKIWSKNSTDFFLVADQNVLGFLGWG